MAIKKLYHAPSLYWVKPVSLWLMVILATGLIHAAQGWAHDFPTSASELNIPSWGSHRQDIRIFIANGEGLKGYPDGGKHLAQQALQQWAPSLLPEKKLVFLDTSEGADIELYWSDQPIPSKISEFAHATCQNSHLQWQNSPPEIVHAKITIGLVHPYTHQPYSHQALQQVITHEMGHALGLPHTQTSNSIMFHRLSETPFISPTPIDVALIHNLYVKSKLIFAKPISTQPLTERPNSVAPLEKRMTVDTF